MKDEDWMLDTVEVWAIALTDLKITRTELFTAQRKSMSLEWPPTAPADFLALGRTETASNYPDMREQYKAAANNIFNSAVTYETTKRVGFWELKTQPESISYKSWQKHYPEVCKEHSEGKDFKVPETHQVAYEHTALQETSPMAATVDEFLNQFQRKHGEQA